MSIRISPSDVTSDSEISHKVLDPLPAVSNPSGPGRYDTVLRNLSGAWHTGELRGFEQSIVKTEQLGERRNRHS